MFEINKEILPQCGEGFFCCVEKLLSTNIVFRLNPLSLEHSPYGFCNIQVRGVRRKIEQEESSLLPKWSSLLKTLGTMNAGIVQYKKCLFTYFEGEVFQKLHDFLGIHIFLRAKLETFTFPVYHGKAIQSCGSLGKDTDLFSWELPSIRDIALRTHMRFIPVVQINLSASCKILQFKEFLSLTLINSLGGFTLGSFPYTFISSAKLFKKRWNVRRLTVLPLDASQAAFAACTFCRSALIAARTDSSSVSLISGLRPCPGFVYKLEMPSAWYRFTQWLTEAKVMSVKEPAVAALNPFALRRTAMQRIRKQWLSPLRYPNSRVWRASGVRSNFFIRPAMDAKIEKNNHISI